MTSLRVLVVGNADPIAGRLQDGGHSVTPVEQCNGAVEALQLQKYDAVVLGQDVRPGELAALSQQIQQINRQSSVRTAVLGVSSQTSPGQGSADIDGYLPEQATTEALSAALMNLSVRSHLAECLEDSHTELPVLNAKELLEQVAFDIELLIEIIDLYFDERHRQSLEMQQALEAGDLQGLSRLAHTLKGSLGNLHAPSAHAEAQALELAAHGKDRTACERFLPIFEHKLNLLDAELKVFRHSLSQGQ